MTTCSYCGSSPVDPDAQLLSCAGCRVAKYCGPKCQVAHWKAHRPACLASDADRTRQLESIDTELAALLADLPGVAGALSRSKVQVMVPGAAMTGAHFPIDYSFASPSLPAAAAAKVRALAQRALALRDEAAAYRLFHLAGSPPHPGELLGSCGGGDAEAQFQAGQMLLRRGGRGTDLEDDRSRLCVAALWLRYAWSQGHAAAGEALRRINAAPSQPTDPPRLRPLLLHLRRHGLLSGSTEPTAAERAEAHELVQSLCQLAFGLSHGVTEAPLGPVTNARTESERQALAEAQAARAEAKAAAQAKADARAREQARAREEAKAAHVKQQGKQ